MTFGAYAQNSVQGKVTDTEGSPIIGAAVLLKGTSNGTLTDTDGAFTLNNEKISGEMPHPKGKINVAYQIGNKKLQAQIETPKQVQGWFIWG